jgi:hypothetical protein
MISTEYTNMKTNITETPLKQYSKIPKYWEAYPNIINYNKLSDATHIQHGWRTIQEPEMTADQVKTGQIIYNEGTDIATYEVRDLTQQELDVRAENDRLNVVNEGRENQRLAIQIKLEQAEIEKVQALTDPEEILQNEYIFPIWEDMPDQYPFALNKKYRSLDGMTLKVFNCIQPHNKVESDPSYIPINAPALWSLIEIGAGGIEVWTQPTGGDGKYPYEDPLTGEPYKVLHNGSTWENNHQGGLNVWEPGVYGWTLIN